MIMIDDEVLQREPSDYDDTPETIKTDRYAIDGSLERTQYQDKKRAKMIFNYARPELVLYFKQKEAHPVTFYNDESVYGVLQFTGVITDIDTSGYFRGSDRLTKLTVVIREV